MFEAIKKLFYPIVALFDFIQKYFKSVVFVTIVILITDTGSSVTQPLGNVQRLDLSGPILDANSLLEKIDKIQKDEAIKGVLLVVNSPGGAVAPSIEIAHAIKSLNEKKPVVVYAGGTIASGSYYASIWGSRIIANPGSMVGSIGVIFQGANVEVLLEKLGIATQTIKAGKYKESGTPTREWTPFEKEELQRVIRSTYDMFVSDVALARKLDPNEHERYANGRVFTAWQAKEIGLVDEVSTLLEAQKRLYEIANIQTPIWVKEDKVDKLFDRFLNEAIGRVTLEFMGELKAY